MRICGLYEEIRNLPGFVYTNGGTPDRQILKSRDVYYTVGKVFSQPVQRRWNHRNRISGSGEKVELCKEWLKQGGRQGRGVCAPRLISQNPQGRLKSGMDGVYSLRMRGLSLTLVIIHHKSYGLFLKRQRIVGLLAHPPPYEFTTYLVSTESYSQGLSTDVVPRDEDQNPWKTSNNTENAPHGLKSRYWCPWSLDPRTLNLPPSMAPFPLDFYNVLE